MKKMTYFVMALALVLGFTQCKKEQIEPQGGQVRITLDVENGGKATDGTRVNVDPYNTPMVTFGTGDKVLVGYNGAYVGTLTHNGTRFEGSINATQFGDQRLYFYFVGNKQETLAVGDESCTVNISDQTKELPVLSFSESNRDFNGAGSYSASLHNQCALVKFTLDNPAGSIMVGNMHTKATISFSKPSITTIEETTGTVRLYSKTDTEKWAILLPQTAVENAPVIIGEQNLTVDVPEITAGAYVTSISTIENDASSLVNLSTLNTDYTANDGDILRGTLDGANNADHRVKISIAAGATITLSNAQILGCLSEDYYKWAGLNCLGDATIIIDDGTTNVVQGSNYAYPGIHIKNGYTLTINANGSGTSTLDARCISTGAGGAGIGAIDNTYGSGTCGNIVINGGVITATGAPGYSNGFASGLPGGAGIGGAPNTSCGTITINGGTVNAIGGKYAAGIGTSSGTQDGGDYYSNCGAITIAGGEVTAHGGLYAAGIGSGYNYKSSSTCNCESVTITGGTVTATGGGDENLYGAGIGSGCASTTTAKSTCGNISISTSGTVTATGGKYAAGIGSGYVYGKTKLPTSSCGNIEITAGTVIATGGEKGAGIGTGNKPLMGTCSCDNITIGTGVTQVTATKGSGATNSIGVGKSGTCGTVTIGGTTGVISDSPYTYQP